MWLPPGFTIRTCEDRIFTDLRHIGTAHNDAELEILLDLAHEKMLEGQFSLDWEAPVRSRDADLFGKVILHYCEKR